MEQVSVHERGGHDALELVHVQDRVRVEAHVPEQHAAGLDGRRRRTGRRGKRRRRRRRRSEGQRWIDPWTRTRRMIDTVVYDDVGRRGISRSSVASPSPSPSHRRGSSSHLAEHVHVDAEDAEDAARDAAVRFDDVQQRLPRDVRGVPELMRVIAHTKRWRGGVQRRQKRS
tara:strand:- start:11 stop:523 length:513 start_codon:yes stop_codon:yes gene_type:complete